MNRLSFDEVCSRVITTEIPLLWKLLYEFAAQAANVVEEHGAEEVVKELAGEICDFIGLKRGLTNAMVVYALLAVLMTYVLVAVESGAMQVFDFEEGDGLCTATSLN